MQEIFILENIHGACYHNQSQEDANRATKVIQHSCFGLYIR